MSDVIVDIGDGTDSNHGIEVLLDGSTRRAHYEASSGKWQYSDDGSSFQDIAGGSSFSAYDSESEDAFYILPADLDDPSIIWDYPTFIQGCRGTSWYAELGPPPVHGFWIIAYDKQSIYWWDRLNNTAYMTLSSGGGNMVGATHVNHLDFKDGILYIAHASAGVVVVDLLADLSMRYSTTGSHLYAGVVSERNAGNGSMPLPIAGADLADDVTYGICAHRHDTLCGLMGRPKHWWVVGVDYGSYCVYNPKDGAVYDHTGTTGTGYYPVVDVAGRLFFNGVTGLEYVLDINTINSDGWSRDNNVKLSNAGVSSLRVISSGNIINSTWPILVCTAASDNHLYIIHVDLDDPTRSGFFAHRPDPYGSGAVSLPYGKGFNNPGTALMAPLEDPYYYFVSNGSFLGSVDMVNTGGVAFTANGLIGKCASFNGAGYLYSVPGGSNPPPPLNPSEPFTISLWFKSHSNVSPSQNFSICCLRDATNTNYLHIYCSNQSIIVGQASSNVGYSDIVYKGISMHDAQWHHIVYSSDGTTYQMWYDGILGAIATNVNALSGGDCEELFLGALDYDTWNTGEFDLDEFSYSKDQWSESEVMAEYHRGITGKNIITQTVGNASAVHQTTDESSRAIIALGPVGNPSLTLLPNGAAVEQIGSTGGVGAAMMPPGTQIPTVAIGTSTNLAIQPQAISSFDAKNNPWMRNLKNIYGPTLYHGQHSIASFDAIVGSGPMAQYRTINDALLAGAKNIKVLSGEFNLRTSIIVSDVRIEGSGRSTVLSNDYDTTGEAIYISGSRVALTNLAIRVNGGGAGGGWDAIKILPSSSNCTISHCAFIDADQHAINASGSGHLFLFNTIEDSDGDGFYIIANGCIVMGNHVGSIGGWGFDLAGDNNNVIGNISEPASYAAYVGGNNNLFALNILNSSISDFGTGNTYSLNEIY